MTNRRKRFLFYFESHALLENIKKIIGRDVEMIAAHDRATIEAAIRLYKQVDIILVERQDPKGPSLKVLEEAQNHLPGVKRVMFANPDAIAGVYEAVYKRVVESLVFVPCREDQLREVLGVFPPSTSSHPSVLIRSSQDRLRTLKSAATPVRP